MADDTSIGDQLLDLCAGANECLVLVAPFIKHPVMERVIQATAPQVEIRCYTRWRPEEIASGVSDITIWHLLSQRQATSLWLVARLHAKYYRADDVCLVGSANLTNRALGWCPWPNLELVSFAPSKHFEGFEEKVRSESVAVDQAIYEATLQAAEAINPYSMPFTGAPSESSESHANEVSMSPSGSYSTWLPSLRHPEDLFLAYVGDVNTLSRTTSSAAKRDLLTLNLPDGLAEPAFRAYVGALLLQQPMVKLVDEFVAEPRRFGAVRELLATRTRTEAGGPQDGPTHAWQSLMRWLLYFLPRRYTLTTPHHSEIFARRST